MRGHGWYEGNGLRKTRDRPHFSPVKISKALDGTFVLSLGRKIIIMVGGVGGRIALLCLGWTGGECGYSLAEP